MEPNFVSGEYILTSKITYKFRSPQRGDVVVFKSPKNPEIDYIKRIIGLPGDKVMIKNGSVYVNDQVLAEPYIPEETSIWLEGFLTEGAAVIVPSNQLFVLGDNRKRSSDSREFGPVPFDTIIGQVFYRYFPTSKMGWITNPLPKQIQSMLPKKTITLHHWVANS